MASEVIRHPKPQSMAEWSPPLRDFWKLNIDGAAKGKPGPASVGGAIRNYQGEWVAIFSKSIGIADFNFIELATLVEGINLVAMLEMG